MRCKSPVFLKNGLVVPCGKCLLCLSAKRDEWSVRVQLHSAAYVTKPFFVTLTYDNDHLVYADEPTLVKSDFQYFIKRLKDRYDLYNTDFSFFGCGEYGDALDRPHCHLILFGFPQLEEAYDEDWIKANRLIRDVWKNGNVDIGVAEYSGMHYVTKYVLKYVENNDYSEKQRPFIVYSNGLGLPWLQTDEAKLLKSRLDLFKLRNAPIPEFRFYDDPRDTLQSFRDAYSELLKFFPLLQVTLPSGRKAPLPRYLKKKLIGSFEHFKDNPLWIMHYVKQVIQSTDYILTNQDYDRESLQSYQAQVIEFAERRILNRLIQKHHL